LPKTFRSEHQIHRARVPGWGAAQDVVARPPIASSSAKVLGRSFHCRERRRAWRYESARPGRPAGPAPDGYTLVHRHAPSTMAPTSRSIQNFPYDRSKDSTPDRFDCNLAAVLLIESRPHALKRVATVGDSDQARARQRKRASWPMPLRYRPASISGGSSWFSRWPHSGPSCSISRFLPRRFYRSSIVRVRIPYTWTVRPALDVSFGPAPSNFWPSAARKRWGFFPGTSRLSRIGRSRVWPFFAVPLVRQGIVQSANGKLEPGVPPITSRTLSPGLGSIRPAASARGCGCPRPFEKESRNGKDREREGYHDRHLDVYPKAHSRSM